MARMARRTEAVVSDLAMSKRQQRPSRAHQRRLSLIPEEMPQHGQGQTRPVNNPRSPSIVQNMFGLAEWDDGQTEVDISALRRIQRPDLLLLLLLLLSLQCTERKEGDVRFNTPNFFNSSPASLSLASLTGSSRPTPDRPRPAAAAAATATTTASWGLGYMASLMGPLGWDHDVPELTPDVDDDDDDSGDDDGSEANAPTPAAYFGVVLDAEAIPIRLAHSQIVTAHRPAPSPPVKAVNLNCKLQTENLPRRHRTPMNSPVAGF